MALSKDWREFLELLNSRGVARSPRFCAVQDDRTCLYRAIAFRCRILLLGLGFFAEPTSPFRFGLLCRCRRCNRFFLLLRWLLDSWLFAVGFFFLWLWFGFLLFRLLFFFRLFLDHLGHIDPLDERHRGRVAFALAKLYDARVPPIALG